jgi:flagellar biosynthesis GTPase FlhF
MKIPHRSIVLGVLFAFSMIAFTGCSKTAGMRRVERNSRRAERSLENSKSRKVQQAEAKAVKQKEQQKAANEKAKAKELKHREKVQTRETRERMKETRKKADQYNNKYREPFFKRIFGRKKPKT